MSAIRPWNVKLGDTVGVWNSMAGYLPPNDRALLSGKVVSIRKRKALFHTGNHWTFHTDNPMLSMLSASRFDTILRIAKP